MSTQTPLRTRLLLVSIHKSTVYEHFVSVLKSKSRLLMDSNPSSNYRETIAHYHRALDQWLGNLQLKPITDRQIVGL
jgi:hypothetical protein